MRGLKIAELKDEELEALVLADAKGLEQEAAARLMNVSRSTFSRILRDKREGRWRRRWRKARRSKFAAETTASSPTSRRLDPKRQQWRGMRNADFG